MTALLVAAALANFVPARRAMRVDPMTALRTDSPRTPDPVTSTERGYTALRKITPNPLARGCVSN